METQQPMLQGWAVAALVVVLPLILFLFYKMFTAKTRKGHWASFGLLMLVVSLLSAGLSESGIFPSQDTLAEQSVQPSPPLLPTPVVVSFALAAVIWIGGGNWIVIRQRRKSGRSWADSLNPFNPPFRDMDRRAWKQIVLLGLLSLLVASVGAELSKPTGTTRQVPVETGNQN